MSFQNDIRFLLASYRPLRLEESEAVKLMNRVDTKYIIRTDDVPELLHDMQPHYHVLEVTSHRTGSYTTTYFDTSDRQMFNAHITGRFPRYKVRERLYSQNGLKFFEVKQKSNKGRTSKKRVLLTEKNNSAYDWLSQKIPFHTDELTPALIISFERITLINNLHTERLTLDFNLHFQAPFGAVTPVYDRVAIVELKQDRTANSPIRESLRYRGIRPGSVSKYCTGMFLTGCETGYKQYKPNFSRFLKAY